MKRYMDKWVQEDLKEWDTRKQRENVKVWIRWRGCEVNPDYPIIRAEHYFPNIEDPRIVLSLFNEFKREWDNSATSWDELTEFRSKNCFVNCILQKPILGTSTREMLDKKIIFKCQEALDECDDPEAELGDGQPDDIYVWATSAPNEMHEIKPGSCRIDTFLGVMIIGRMNEKHCPTSKDGKPMLTKGCYAQNICACDVKAGKWMNKILIPIAADSVESLNGDIRKYADANMDKLKRHVEDLDKLYKQQENV